MEGTNNLGIMHKVVVEELYGHWLLSFNIISLVDPTESTNADKLFNLIFIVDDLIAHGILSRHRFKPFQWIIGPIGS